MSDHPLNAQPDTQTAPWTPGSWSSTNETQYQYPDAGALDAARARLRDLPPLVTSWEIEKLREQIAQAQRGERFILQGGDCAEMLDLCRSDLITNKLKILLQMSLVLIHGLRMPVTRVGRQAPFITHRNQGHRGERVHAPELLRRPGEPHRLQRIRAHP